MQLRPTLTREWFAIVLLILLKVVLAALTLLAKDVVNWVFAGMTVLSGQVFQGVYTGPAYIYALAYLLWRALGGSPTIAQRLLIVNYGTKPGVLGPSITQDMFAFMLVMKIPLLIADMVTMFLIMRIVKKTTGSKSNGMTAGLLWAGSPLVFLSEMFNATDIFAGLLIILGVYVLYRSRIKVGSVCFALGTALRFSPLLFAWVYPVAFVRLRNWKYLRDFFVVQVSLLVVGATYVIMSSGALALGDIFTSSYTAGILVPEAIVAIGPSIAPQLPYNPFSLGLSATVYVALAYFITKPKLWHSRMVGAEAIALLATFFAFAEFFPQFLMWALPLLVVYATTTKFGSLRFICLTALGALTVVFGNSRYLSADGKAVFFIPNLNASMVMASSMLNGLDSLTSAISFFHSAFSAMLVLVIFWIVVERRPIRSVTANSERQ
jgi:hypothetical protein